MPRLPKISIITPSYNQGDYIDLTIRSVLDQEYPYVEYIVMDGGSTDRTLDILNNYGKQIIWVSQKDRGQSDAINQGLSMATGDVVSYLNSDDLLEPGSLFRVGEFFSSHPKANWLAGRCRMIDSAGTEIRKAITWYKNIWLFTRSYQVLQILDFVSQPATFWRRQVLEKVGLFDDSLHLAMDYDFSLRVGQYFELWTIHEYLASFRVHSNAKSSLLICPHFDEDLNVLKRHITSPLFIYLHKYHNLLIVNVYRFLSILDNHKSSYL